MYPNDAETEALCTALHTVFGEAADEALAARICADERTFIRAFSDGETVYENGSALPALGFLLCGGAEIVRQGGNCEVFLRSMTAGDAFGAAALFAGDAPYVTTVRAKGATRVLFLPQTAAEALLAECPRAALGYIAFLSAKIRYLNQKLSTFTAGSAVGKLSGYLLSQSDADGRVALPGSYARLATALGLGRASLYRALDELCDAGIIERGAKELRILDREALQ